MRHLENIFHRMNLVFITCTLLILGSYDFTDSQPGIYTRAAYAQEAYDDLSQFGTCLLTKEKEPTGLDLTNTIAEDIWDPRCCTGETDEYYIVCQTSENFPVTNMELDVYRSTTNPHQYPWEYLFTLSNQTSDLYNHDIEVVLYGTSQGHLIFSVEESRVIESFWWDLDNPDINGFAVVDDESDWDYSLSLASSHFVGSDVDVFASWVENDKVKFARSVDNGASWEDAVVVAEPTIPPSSALAGGDVGQGMACCPANQKVYIIYVAPVDPSTQAIFVAQSIGQSGSGGWELMEIAQQGNIQTYDRGITSMNGYNILLYWRYLNTLRYAYADDAWQTWSPVYDFNFTDINGVSGASNNDGYFNIFYSSTNQGLVSMRTYYTDLSSTSSWSETVVDSLFTDTGLHACIADGSFPDHGGVWSYAQQYSCFGWAGEPELEILTPELFFQRQEGTALPEPQPIVITNNGDCGMGWDAEDDSPWMAINPTLGSDIRPGGTDTIWVSINPDWPGAGYYFGTVTITSPGAEGSPQYVDVELQCYGDVLITMSPLNPPIVIPEDGGSFDFNIAVENLSPDPQTFDLWTQIRLPQFGTLQILLVSNVALSGYGQFNRDRIQTVPAFAPAGEYYYWGFVGEHPWVIDGASAFTLVKDGSGDGGRLGKASDWFYNGNPFDEINEGEAHVAPTDFALYPAYPNPFNPTTTIRFGLPEAGWVRLEVFDIAGRLCGSGSGATIGTRTPITGLVNGYRQAGYHEVTFDASQLSSGMYFYRLTASNMSGSGATPTMVFSLVRKMVLVK